VKAAVHPLLRFAGILSAEDAERQALEDCSMKNKRGNYLAITMLLMVFLQGGCGGGGKDSPGVKMSATITPTYNGGNSFSIDAVRTNCTDGSKTQPEYFADHTATASISASLINPSNIINKLTVYIDSYTITYSSHADSPGAPPIQADTREKTISFIVSGEGPASVEATLSFVDLIRKNQYYNNVGGGLNNYTATYTFQGHSENGVQFTFNAQTDFQIGSFNYCPSGFTPI